MVGPDKDTLPACPLRCRIMPFLDQGGAAARRRVLRSPRRALPWKARPARRAVPDFGGDADLTGSSGLRRRTRRSQLPACLCQCRRNPVAVDSPGQYGRAHGGLPLAGTEDAFTAICQDEAALRPGVERLCQRLGVDVSGLTRYAAGSLPVYAAGDMVLKLFPPVARWPGYRVEAEVLAAVQGKLPTPTPLVHAAGEHDGWGYVLMSRLPGVPLDTVWDQLSAGDRGRRHIDVSH